MLKKNVFRLAALDWIRRLPTGTKFTYREVYDFLEREFPKECAERESRIRPPRYKRHARLAIYDAMPERLGLAKHTGVPGQRVRI